MRCVYGLPTHVQVLYTYVCAFVHLSFDVSDVRNDQKEADPAQDFAGRDVEWKSKSLCRQLAQSQTCPEQS